MKSLQFRILFVLASVAVPAIGCGQKAEPPSWVAQVVGQHRSVAEKVLGAPKELKGVGYYDSLAKQVRRIGESFASYTVKDVKNVTVGYGYTEHDYETEFQVLLLNVFLKDNPTTWEQALEEIGIKTKGVIARVRKITDGNTEVDLKSLPGFPPDWYCVYSSIPGTKEVGTTLHFVHPEFQSDAVKEWMKSGKGSP